MKSAFRFEVRPDVYLGRVWATAVVVAIALAAIYACKGGSFDPALVVPLDGWHARDPAGALYVDTWAAIFSDAVQVGFGLWSVVLLVLGLYRLVASRKFVVTCFSLGGAFAGVAFFIPSWTAILAKFLVERYPFLVN